MLYVAAFLGATSLLILVPGPDNVLVVRAVLVGGRTAGLRTAAGVITGLLVWALAAAAGLSALLAASRVGYDALRLVSAGYLLWLGASSLRGAGRRTLAGTQAPGLAPPGYRLGVLTNLLNPKVGIFFVAFLPGFVPHGAPVGPTTLLLGALFVLEGAFWFWALIGIVARGTAWIRRPGLQRRLDRLTGAVLIGFGLRLALTRG